MIRETKTLVRHTAIYTFGTILRNLASIVMLPIYTRHLSPSDYGVIELLSTTVDLFAVVFGLRVGEAIFRYHASYQEIRDKNEVISTALILVAGLTLCGLLLLVSLGNELSMAVFGTTKRATEMRLYGITLPLSALVELAFISLRAEQRPWSFVLLSTLRLVLQLSFNIYFVVFRQMRVSGVIYSAVLSSSSMFVVLTLYTVSHTGLRFSGSKARELAIFSWPLVLSSVATFFFTSSDRFFLRHFGNTAEVGIYSLGYRFGYLLLAMGWAPFSGIWDSQRYVVLKSDDPKIIFNKTFVVVSLTLIFGALGIAVFSQDVLRIMSNRRFWDAYEVVPMILIAYVFQAWTSFTNVGLLLHGKTLHTFYSTIAAAVVAAVGYVILIPRFGAIGAAVATMVGFIARFAWIYSVSQSSYDMGLRWGKVAKISVLAIVIYLLSLFVPSRIVWTITIHAMEMVLFLGLLLVLPVFDPQERASIISLIRNPRAIRAFFFASNAS
ncbi:MAG: lipopolysaccharide biosynthesis protein [Acidiferrobacterales bacterium]